MAVDAKRTGLVSAAYRGSLEDRSCEGMVLTVVSNAWVTGWECGSVPSPIKRNRKPSALGQATVGNCDLRSRHVIRPDMTKVPKA